jgi:hypothetical protein
MTDDAAKKMFETTENKDSKEPTGVLSFDQYHSDMLFNAYRQSLGLDKRKIQVKK